MGRASGFSWIERKSGEIIVERDGRAVTVLRGRRAVDFVEAVESGDAQEVMAPVTGNCKRGNERQARKHRNANATRREG